MEAVCSAILFVGFAKEEPSFLHALQQRRNGIWIAAHELRQLTLRNAIIFEKCPYDRKLVGRDFEMRRSPAKGLVETVPGAAQQEREAFALGGIESQVRNFEILSCGGHKLNECWQK